MGEIRDGRATYIRIADQLRELITSGQVPLGEWMPSYHDLAEQHQVAMATVQKAMGVLREEGMVASAPGQGTWVTSVEVRSMEFATQHALDTALAKISELEQQITTLQAAMERLGQRQATPPPSQGDDR